MKNTAQILDEHGARYGVFMQQAQIAQSLHMALERGMKLSGKTRFSFAPDQLEAMNMIVNKLARIFNGDPHYSDSWRDVAGYATLVADRLDNDTANEQKLIDDRSSNAEPTWEESIEQQADKAERLEVQDGTHRATSETHPGVPGTHRQ